MLPAASRDYWLLRQDARLDYWHAVLVDGVSLDALRTGLAVDPPGAPARVTVEAGGRERSDLLELPCLVVSNAMRRALDHAGVDNVQYFPAHVAVEFSGEPDVTDYWVANLVGAVACAGAPSAAAAPARAFRIDPKRARGFDLFRLAEDRRLLVVSGRVADALRTAGLGGLVLQDPETYDGLPVSTAPRAAESAESDRPRTADVRR